MIELRVLLLPDSATRRWSREVADSLVGQSFDHKFGETLAGRGEIKAAEYIPGLGIEALVSMPESESWAVLAVDLRFPESP